MAADRCSPESRTSSAARRSSSRSAPACTTATTPCSGGFCRTTGTRSPAPSPSGWEPDEPRLEIPVGLLHVAAASVWLGGLVGLVLLLQGPGERRLPLRRFSNLALTSVAVLAATGVLRAFSELRAFGQLWSTGYGRVLVVK